MEGIITIMAGVVTLAIIVIKYFVDRKRKIKKEEEDFDKALATNDFSYLSDDLDDKLHRMRKKNIQSGSKR